MILTCPNCSTRYVADADKIGPEGRQVRCAACGETWRAMPEPPPSPPEPTEIIEPDLVTELIEPEALAVRQAEPPPVTGAVVSPGRRRWGFMAAVWGGAGAALIGAFALAYVFRVELVRAWPGLASAFQLAGVEANANGIVFEELTANRRYVEGRTMLTVTATFTNPTGRTRPVPPVRVSLRDGSGAEVYAQVARAAARELAAGDSFQFGLVIEGPPDDAQDLELTFLDDADAS